MTTIDATAPATGIAAPRPTPAGRTRQGRIAGAPLAIAGAVLAGIVLGASAALAIPAMTADPALERARLIEFAEELHEAVWRDHQWELSHP